ncbi:MAG TPA: beta-glucanase/beta-glucan synthetase [Bacteroidales bacterium]|jgi:beta-glucanase (GH16 family)|nr:beta-glucanase/beta-glucan synthetase [Bacteroidales bacterium]
MQKLIFNMVALLGLAIIFTSCNPENSPKAREVIYPASNLLNDDYEPGEGWILKWSDEFTEKEVGSHWTRQVYPDGNWNKEWQKYTASDENTYIDNGCLVLAAHHTSAVHDTFNYTSSRIHTAQSHSWKYGKFVARIQLPYGNGTWPAFWMMGDNIDENGGDTPWPFCGEIDILEMYGSKNDSVLEANIHFWNDSLEKPYKHDQMGAKSTKLETGIFADAFHVFEIEWNEEWVIWRLNSEEYARFDITKDYLTEFRSEKFFILLNLAIGGAHAGVPDESTVFPQYMYVDWVRVYQREKSD